eukprot:NODE_1187_length_1215_cov_413.352586.p1 GENE.NODE_1187_length_1215_cov_413.352586~~NODE_1187_length_1215_cov_413.352586.p1  ORF type:complete len:381 (+),score=127.08 NODE_1187_length_1215_cov_413.352586:3-1145(+)
MGETAVMVSHCWDEAVDVFLLDVLTMTHNVRSGGMFICFLSLYQGENYEVNLQVTQGDTSGDISKGCFSEVLSTVKRNNGNMLVVSNAAVCSSNGLYSRLWCVWEVYCAVRDGVPVVLHPRTRTEQHLYGDQGEMRFDPKEARCGDPNKRKKTPDEISIRRAIDATPTSWLDWFITQPNWAGIKAAVTSGTRGRGWRVTEPCTLEASYSGLDDRGVELLLEAMKEDPWPYTTFMLRWSSIGDRAAEALAEALKSNNTLKDLYLYQNRIGSDGAKALAEALKTNKTLEVLRLQDNNIGDDGTKALAEALKTNRTLKILDLSLNRISSDGAKALAEALKTNRTLDFLNLDGNRISSDGAKALRVVWKDTNRRGRLDLLLQRP